MEDTIQKAQKTTIKAIKVSSRRRKQFTNSNTKIVNELSMAETFKACCNY